jgi:tetratricopeptide (TPR) repeat protein
MGRRIHAASRVRKKGRANFRFEGIILMSRRSAQWKWFLAAVAFAWWQPLGAQLMPPTQPTLPGVPAANAWPAAQANKSGTQPSDELRTAYDAAFQESLDHPSDPAVLVKFAETAVQLGDIEGAISALERLLLIDGKQADVKLELGVLYYRLGSTEPARAYLESASASPEASAEVRERAQAFLKAIPSK